MFTLRVEEQALDDGARLQLLHQVSIRVLLAQQVEGEAGCADFPASSKSLCGGISCMKAERVVNTAVTSAMPCAWVELGGAALSPGAVGLWAGSGSGTNSIPPLCVSNSWAAVHSGNMSCGARCVRPRSWSTESIDHPSERALGLGQLLCAHGMDDLVVHQEDATAKACRSEIVHLGGLNRLFRKRSAGEGVTDRGCGVVSLR